MEKLIKYLWGAFLFIFPFSIRWIVFDYASYRTGNFNPWVTVFVYLPEILLLTIFALWLIRKLAIRDSRFAIRDKVLWFLLLLFAVNAFAVSMLSGFPIFGGIFVLRMFEGLIIFWLINDKIFDAKHTVTILMFGAIFQILWGYFQWSFNHSLGLKILGESVIGPDVLGVAKNDIAEGVKQIRAYGSFLHPNIFAAYLLTILFISMKYLNRGSKLFWLIIFGAGIYMTGSRAAMLVGVISFFLYVFFSFAKAIPFRRSIGMIAISLLAVGNLWYFEKSPAIKTNDISFQERLDQNTISKNMWKANPWGVGVGNFTLEMEKYNNCGAVVEPSLSNGGASCGRLMPWDFQPVHNTFFLILNETGIQGLMILLLFFMALFDLYWRDGKGVAIFSILLLAPFDHFLWDSWTGMVIIALAAGFFALENRAGMIEKIEEAVHI